MIKMDRIIVTREGIESKCNEFKPFRFNEMDYNEQRRLGKWLNQNLKEVSFNLYLESTEEDEYGIEKTLKKTLKKEFKDEIFSITVTKKLIIIGVVSNYTLESCIKDDGIIKVMEDFLGLSDYESWYDDGEYSFDHMVYAFYLR